MNELTDEQALVGMLELLQTPERWCRGSMAQTEYGGWADPLDPNACRFCVYGAYVKVMGVGARERNTNTHHRIRRLLGLPNFGEDILAIGTWNDLITYEEMRGALERALVRVRGQG